MKEITIFTPTYNRANLLTRLYQSLKMQTCREFQWLIVDDGSTDDTKNMVEKFIQDDEIAIKYYYQKNSGKHVAHNLGVKMCDTELFCCVDSDDSLTNDAVQTVLECWRKKTTDEKTLLSGIVAYRGYNTEKIIGTEFPAGMNEAALKDLYANGKKGDTALVYRTDVLIQYPFPEVKGEKFIRENLAYDLIDEKYCMCVLRKIIYIGEYQEDGLTNRATELEMKSPYGAAMYRYGEYTKAADVKNKIRQLAAYIFFMNKAGRQRELLRKVGIVRVIILSPLAFLGGIRYKFILKGKQDKDGKI